MLYLLEGLQVLMEIDFTPFRGSYCGTFVWPPLELGCQDISHMLVAQTQMLLNVFDRMPQGVQVPDRSGLRLEMLLQKVKPRHSRFVGNGLCCLFELVA